MNLIGISAKMGCGKTTLADLLLAHGGTRLAFGDLLKRECAAAFSFPLEWCYSQEGKERRVANSFGDCGTVRQALQWYGTDYRRAQNPGYWVDAMRERLSSMSGLVVVDDVRFEDEAQLILALGGFLVRLEPFPGWTPGPHADHASETALDEFRGFSLVLRPEFGELPSVADIIREAMEAR